MSGMRRVRHSAPAGTSRLSIPIIRPSRWSFSSRWCGGFSAARPMIRATHLQLPLFLRPAHEVAREDDTRAHAANDQAGEGIDVRADAEFHFRVDDHGEGAGARP